MYGRLYIPTGRLDALYSVRLSATVQGLIAAISAPPLNAHSEYHGNRAGNLSNAMFSLQHDVGKWCTEYTYSAEDGMCGIKLLHNFGKLSGPVDISEESDVPARPHVGIKRVDEEEPIEGGLKGRVSIGAELYASARERSAGGQSVVEMTRAPTFSLLHPVSAGIRFTTSPDATPPSYQDPSPSLSSPKPILPQPPTTITALFNPMLGYVATAYTAQVSRDLSLSSRFEFNVYSFESDWTMGAEWWLRGHRNDVANQQTEQEVCGALKARASTSNVS